MPNIKPVISIIIVSYNVKDYLCKCIDSLLVQTNSVTEIIVVDNGSTDGSCEAIKSNYPSVKLIRNTVNTGFSAANNLGIAVASGDIILLLNPDTQLLDISCLFSLNQYFNSLEFTGILAPKLINSDGTNQVSYWHFPRVTDILFELFYLHRKSYKDESITPFEIEGASGAALCFRKHLIEEIGGMDEALFWMEDIDFCYRAHKAGKKIIYHPAIKILHHGGKSSVNKYNITIPNQVMSKVKFFKKHGSVSAFYFASFLTFFFIITRLLAFTALTLTLNGVCRQKANAYAIALKVYFGYILYGKSDIISDK